MENQTATLTFETRLVTSIFYLVLSVIGVVLYIFDMFVMFKHRNSFNNAFYILVAYLAMGDIMLLFQVIFYVVPFSITNKFFIPEYLAQILANGDSFFFNTIFTFLGPIALNRLMAIIGSIYPQFSSHFVYDMFVHKTSVHIIAICCWIYGIGISVALDVIADCPKTFSLETMTFGYNCANFGHPLFVYYATMAWVYPTFCFLLYMVMYVLLKKRAARVAVAPTSRSVYGMSSTNREIKLVVQASIICTTFLVETMTYNYLRGYGYWSDFTITTMTIINSSVNPVVYLLFNSTLRKKALESLGLKRDRVVTVQMTTQRVGKKAFMSQTRF